MEEKQAPQIAEDPLVTCRLSSVRWLFGMVCQVRDAQEGEAITLRALAVKVGVEPMEATPYNLRGNFAHKFKPGTKNESLCDWCYLLAGDAIHETDDIEPDEGTIYRQMLAEEARASVVLDKDPEAETFTVDSPPTDGT